MGSPAMFGSIAGADSIAEPVFEASGIPHNPNKVTYVQQTFPSGEVDGTNAGLLARAGQSVPAPDSGATDPGAGDGLTEAQRQTARDASITAAKAARQAEIDEANAALAVAIVKAGG